MKMPIQKVDDKTPGSVLLLEGTVPKIDNYHHVIAAGTSLTLEPNIGAYHVMFQVSGNATYESGGTSNTFDERVSYIPALDKELVVKALEKTCIYEMRIKMDETDMEFVKKYNKEFPSIQKYYDAIQYLDGSKTIKTIGRLIVLPHTIPRFCTGSVEMLNADRQTPHAHDVINQYFFTFPEHNADITSDGEVLPLEGNSLLFIPKFGDHAVECHDGEHNHYMWIDILDNETIADTMEKGHKPTGRHLSFDKN